MYSFHASYEWGSRNQDGDIPPLLTGRERNLGGIGRIGQNHCFFEHALIVSS
ncbi:hypothetical protein SAMN05421736_101896 [Evansella caseinilytica]|uniref:Uncharacterized protein n=1 Tax=Evansella caseinilytica TaxID=1503961 RepID=A0A1H3IQK8_9BACI|nr:hypothetical protein SAMN05421736_101896 [Evansella caseinilytica]